MRERKKRNIFVDKAVEPLRETNGMKKPVNGERRAASASNVRYSGCRGKQ